MAPVSLIFSQKTFVQLGGEKMALLTSRPTLRRSMSKAATISMSPGRYEPIWRCINPMPAAVDGGAVIKIDSLDKRAGAVSNADDGDSYFSHF